MSTDQSASSAQPKPLKVALPGQIEILRLLVKEFEDWMDEHENDASRRSELKARLDTILMLRTMALVVDQDDPLTKAFREQYCAAIARGRKALEREP